MIDHPSGPSREERATLQWRRCRQDAFTEAEFDEVLRCTAPWKACGVDSVYSFPIKNARRQKSSLRACEEGGRMDTVGPIE